MVSLPAYLEGGIPLMGYHMAHMKWYHALVKFWAIAAECYMAQDEPRKC